MTVDALPQRRGEVFAVTVPDIGAARPVPARLKRRYALIMARSTAVLTAVGVSGRSGNEAVVMAVLCVGTLLLCVGGYGLMLHYRAKMKSYKTEQGWQASARSRWPWWASARAARRLAQVESAVPARHCRDAGHRRRRYAQMPDLIPQHMNFEGTVTEPKKTPITIVVPALIEAFVAACMAFRTGPSCTRRGSNPPHLPPRRSPTACSRARRASCWWRGGLCSQRCWAPLELSFIGVIGLGQAACSWWPWRW